MASHNTVISIILRAVDRTKAAFKSVVSGANEASQAIDKTERKVGGLRSALSKLGSWTWNGAKTLLSVPKTLFSMGANLGGIVQTIQSAFSAIQSIVSTTVATVQTLSSKLWGAIQESFKFETLTVQFKTLLGSAEEAKRRMASLAEFAEVTPFNLEEVVKASRTLTVLSDGALGTEYSLRLVGDAAAATGASFEEVAFWVGRAYAMIKGGQPFGEAALRLQELGILTPAVRTEMEALQASGAKNSEVWEAFAARLEEFGGAMEDLSQTGDGLTSTLKDTWTAAVREFGDVFSDAAKESIGFLITILGKLKADGTIKEWAQAALKALTPVKDLITAILGGGEERSSALKVAWDYLKAVWDYAADVIKASVKYAGRMLVAYAYEASTAFAWSESKEKEAMRIAKATKKGAYWGLDADLTRASGNLKWTTKALAKEAAVLADRTRKRVEAEAKAAESARKRADTETKAEVAEAQTKPRETDEQAKETIKNDLDEASRKRKHEQFLKDRENWEKEQKLREDLERYEAVYNAFMKFRAEDAKRLSDLDKKLIKLKEREADYRARALDSEKDKRRREEEKEEKKQKEREEKLNRDAWALLRKHATLSDPYALLRRDFDISKLGHRGRALREWMIASLLGNDATKERTSVVKSLERANRNIKAMRDAIEKTQKSLDALLRQS